jgi:hypothetical protein
MGILGATCTLIIANVCLQNVNTIEIHDSGLSASASVRGETFSAEILYLRDSFSTPDWRRMESACEEGECIAYHKWCSETDKIFCRYEFSRPGDMANNVIEISANDKRGLLDGERAFEVITDASQGYVEIPLTRFDKISDTEWTTSCSFRQSQTTCWPAPAKK